MSDDFKHWTEWLPVFEGKPENTVKAYSQGVRRIVSFAEGVADVDSDPKKFGPGTFDQLSLIEVVRRIIESGTVTKATLNQSLAGLQSFYDWCVNTKPEIRSNDLPDIKRLRKVAKLDVPQVDPDYYRPDELRRLYEEAANPDCVVGKTIRHSSRDLAICSFLAVLGLRASELTNAKIGWITQETLEADDKGRDEDAVDEAELLLKLAERIHPNLRTADWRDREEDDTGGDTQNSDATDERIWVMQVEGKGGKKRRVPLTPELIEANRRWQNEREELQGVDIPRPGDYLFVPLRRPKSSNGANKFSYYQLWYLLQMIAREAHLRELGAHALRHTAGVQMALDGVAINRVQGLLGHASIATTGIYTELADIELLGTVRDAEANRLLGEVLNSSSAKAGETE